MTIEAAQYLQHAIDRLAQSDPLLKLLQEVRLGRMKPIDPGLRAITESWLETYRRVLEGATMLSEQLLLRLDPAPRMAVLIEAGMIPADAASVVAVLKAFDAALGAARQGNRQTEA
jgi:hypothetical protein